MKPATLGLRWEAGNAVELLRNGVQWFPALCRAIDAAQRSVHLETYIFRLDAVGEQVLAALEAAAARGVKVRVVIDGFGSAGTAAALLRRVGAFGQCRVYRPEPRWFGLPTRSRLRRLHRKVTTIDGELAFVGGINIADDFEDTDPATPDAPPRFDFAVALRGPLLADAVRAQQLLWTRLGLSRLRHRPREWRRLALPPALPRLPAQGSLRAAFVLRDNLRFRQTIENAYLQAIVGARREILIANAYFLPGRHLRRALLHAARRGVRVRVLLQGKIEYRLQYYATCALYGTLLKAGIEIYEYMPSNLHAKVAVIDDIATVGSANLDPFSLLLAREANVFVDDPGFAAGLRQALDEATAAGGRRVDGQEYGRRGFWLRAAHGLAYRLLRLGVALSGRGQEY